MEIQKPQSFWVEWRGLRAAVEPANGTNRWEICFASDDSDWRSLGAHWPATSLDEARALAVEMCKKRHPSILAGHRIERARLDARIREMEVQ